MTEILGPSLILKRYQYPKGFDLSGLKSDLGYFIREQGPSVARKLFPDIKPEFLTRLQYAPDIFSYHLVGSQLIAGEDLKAGKIIDARERIDRTELLRGAPSYQILSRLQHWLLDGENHPDNQTILWVSPKEGFSRHAYINLGIIRKDKKDRRSLMVTAYMNDFSQEQLLPIIFRLTGEIINPDTSPPALARKLFLANSTDLIEACYQSLGPDCSIEGIPINHLYGKASRRIWEIINQVVVSRWENISRVITQVHGEIRSLEIPLAQAVVGLIRSTLEQVSGPSLSLPSEQSFSSSFILSAFATALAGCVGFGNNINQVFDSQIIPQSESQNTVNCPNCRRLVHCRVGESCPGCKQIRPC